MAGAITAAFGTVLVFGAFAIGIILLCSGISLGIIVVSLLEDVFRDWKKKRRRR